MAILSITLIFSAWGAIEQRANTAGYTSDGGMVDWIIRWAVIAIVIGLVASIIFPYVSARLQWTKISYLLLSALLMITLNLLAYLPIYDGSVHVYPVAYIGLNIIFCLGFGILLPRLSGVGHHGRAVQ